MNFETPNACLTFNLLRAARSATRRLEAALEPIGLTAQQFSALAMLSGHGTLTTTRLAELTGTDRTTMSRNLGVLRRRGFVQAAEDEDRRVSAVTLSEAGRALLDQAMPLWLAAQQQNLERLGSDDAERLLHLLAKL